MTPLGEFKHSSALSLGVELELQLVSRRDYDLTRAATDLLADLDYDGQFGDIKLEITESMIEVSTQARDTTNAIYADLEGLQRALERQCQQHNIGICGGGTHPFHRWSERRICPGERFDAVYQRFGYLAKQFTVFGQHVHIGCDNADDAIWLTQALGVYVPVFIALSAASPYVDGIDTFFQSARLNAVSAFPMSGQCPPLSGWQDFTAYFEALQNSGVAQSIKDLYWDVRPKPEFGTVELRVCDTPLTIEQATALTALAQSLARWLLRTRPTLHTEKQAFVARHNKFQACRYGLSAILSDPVRQTTIPLQSVLTQLFDDLSADAAALNCQHWLTPLVEIRNRGEGEAQWLRGQYARQGNLNDVVRAAVDRFANPGVPPAG